MDNSIDFWKALGLIALVDGNTIPVTLCICGCFLHHFRKDDILYFKKNKVKKTKNKAIKPCWHLVCLMLVNNHGKKSKGIVQGDHRKNSNFLQHFWNHNNDDDLGTVVQSLLLSLCTS